MSAPARSAALDPVPRRSASPRRAPVRRPVTARGGAPRPGSRGSTSFWVLTSLVVTVLIVGVVSLSALLVQASFQEQRIRTQLEILAEEHEALALEVVGLSSPPRIAAWATEEGMVVAPSVEVLLVRMAKR